MSFCTFAHLPQRAKKFAGQAVGGITWSANVKVAALSVGAHASHDRRLFLLLLIGTIVTGRVRLIGIALFIAFRIVFGAVRTLASFTRVVTAITRFAIVVTPVFAILRRRHRLIRVDSRFAAITGFMSLAALVAV